MRNRALRPLDGRFEFNNTPYYDTPYTRYEPPTTRFDKLLFINDVVFSARDAADLLFATNAGPDGRSNYHAACAMDFANAFKFYDTFASRDAEGYRTGVPFFPWFPSSGRAVTRAAVLSQTDAVPMRSCWGGMAAFEAKWFQPPPTSSVSDARPLRFRADDELFWDSSECCLIHADLAYMASREHPPSSSSSPSAAAAANPDNGIYINPYIRVAYSRRAFAWLEFTRRFERLYTLPHYAANYFSGMPVHQERRAERPGDAVLHQEWVYDGVAAPPADIDDDPARYGHWADVRRVAKPGTFCGCRFLLTMKRESLVEGERMWRKILPPPGWRME